MVKHLLTLSLALTLIWGCDGKKSETKTAQAKSVQAGTAQTKSVQAGSKTAIATATATSAVAQAATKGKKVEVTKTVKSLKAALGKASAASAKKLADTSRVTAKAGAKVNVGPEALMDPSKAIATCPNTLVVKFETTKGDFKVQVNRHWAPTGADRFYNLVKAGFFTDIAFFRVIPGFMAQFGIHGDPKVAAKWKSARIQDDKVNSQIASNTRGKLTFATAGPNTRSSQFFVNFSDGNARLDGMGFAPIGEVIEEGMTIVDSIYSGYGEGAPRGKGPDQGRLQTEGNKYLKAEFDKMDYIKSVSVVSESAAVSGPKAAASAKPAPAAEPVKEATPENSDLIKRATSLKERMCACKDRECTKTVSKDAMGMNAEFMKATPGEKIAMRKLGAAMGQCIMKLGPPGGSPKPAAASKSAPERKVAPAKK
jgi:peptidyl-prolyl cis-trans isomerase A (cyclophilin A)